MTYVNLKNWRLRTKDRIIISMGGSCCLCGYNRCPDALAIHHLDPQQKDFNLGGIRARPKSWSKIVAELRKCVLLCHVCHSEVHAGYAVVPQDAKRFNEYYSSYESFPKAPQDNCPVCDSLKPIDRKTCSRSCSLKQRAAQSPINWQEIDLTKELKTKSILALSREIGCSDAAIHKRIKKLGLKA